jgi:membrane-bound lytic murein transglycosylase D
MLRTPIRRVGHALGRRKLETLSLALVAAVSAIGLVRRDSQARPLSSVASAVSVPVAAMMTPAEDAAAAVTANIFARANKKNLAHISHPLVDSWIKRFTTDQRGSFATYLSRMTKYEGMITSKLAAKGMPQGLIYLAMIESGFNPTAKSPVQARGLWQFMGPTAKQYGLTVNRKVDERVNPARSTDAAVKYLSSLYDRLGSWYLAAAAYNSGEGTVLRAMKKATGRTRGTDADYYRISSILPKETRDYVPKMIAASRIGSNPARYGFAD